MLYTADSAVPWNGLASVTEAPSGGDAQDYYIDGMKTLNIAALEEFAGTIEAFSSPVEFAPCAGRLEISPALYVADQAKRSFGFSYRTLLGNDVSGISLGYRLHLVYNALAKISDFSHGTNSETVNVIPYSWAITTIPEVVTGFKPTSHFVVDTISLDPDILGQLEAILYGDDDNDPRFPSAQEFVTLTS